MDTQEPNLDNRKNLFKQTPDPASTSTVLPPPKPPGKDETLKILGINIGIYLIYFFLGLAVPSWNGLVWSAYLLHAVILLILAIIRGIGKGKNAGSLGFAAIVMFIIGFGGCSIAVANNWMKV